MRRTQAFTLIELVIAIGIIAVALLSVVALLVPAFDAGRQSASQTVVGVILEDVHNRLEGAELKEGEILESPFFYDDQGLFINKDEPEEIQASRNYRAEVEFLDISGTNAPDSTSTSLKAVRVELFHPIDPFTGNALPAGTAVPNTSITYYATPLTGPDWQEIDSSYKPRIEF